MTSETTEAPAAPTHPSPTVDAPPLPPWLGDTDLAIFDLETTGLEPGKDRIIQIAVLHVNRGRTVTEWQTFVDPEMPIPKEATEVHHTTDEMVKGAPTLAEIKTEILWRLGLRETGKKRLLVAYNGYHFDAPFLTAELARVGVQVGRDIPASGIRTVDPIIAVRIVDRWVKGKGRHQLPAVCARHKIPTDFLRAHEARSDVWMAWGVLRVLAGYYSRWGVHSPERLWPWQEKTAAAQQRDYEAYVARREQQERDAEGNYSTTGENPSEAIEHDIGEAARDPAEGDRT